MKIGIDAQTILNPSLEGGIGLGHYTYQIIKHLLQIDKQNQYYIFVNYRLRTKDWEMLKQYPNVVIKRLPFSEYEKVLSLVYTETVTASVFSRAKLDVLLIPGGMVPVGYRGKIVTTANNVAVAKYPELFSRHEITQYRLKSPAYHSSETVIALSESQKKDLKDLFFLPEEKIKVIYNGFAQQFYQKATTVEVQKLKQRYGIIDKYILFMNTLKPLNNLTRLIEAFAKMQLILKNTNFPDTYQLVLSGKGGWRINEAYQAVKDFGLDDQVVFTDYVMPQDLNALFDGASALVSIPIYEDFGAVILEAFANGVPVICSNIGSCKEVAGGAAMLVDPYNIDDIKESLLEVIRNKNLQQQLCRDGLRRSYDFNWQNTAKQTKKVLEGNI